MIKIVTHRLTSLILVISLFLDALNAANFISRTSSISDSLAQNTHHSVFLVTALANTDVNAPLHSFNEPFAALQRHQLSGPNEQKALAYELAQIAIRYKQATTFYSDEEISAIQQISVKIEKNGDPELKAALVGVLSQFAVVRDRVLSVFARDMIIKLSHQLKDSVNPNVNQLLEYMIDGLPHLEFFQWTHIYWLLELLNIVSLEHAQKLAFTIVAIIELLKIKGGTAVGERMGGLAKKMAIALGSFLSRLNEPADLWFARSLVKTVPRIRLGVYNDLENAWAIAEELDEVSLNNRFSKQLRERIHAQFSTEDETFLDAYLLFLKTGETNQLDKLWVFVDEKDMELRQGILDQDRGAMRIYESLLELRECLARVLDHVPEDLLESCRSLASCANSPIEEQIIEMQKSLQNGERERTVLLAGPIRLALQDKFFKTDDPKELVGIANFDEDLERVSYIQLGELINSEWGAAPEEHLEAMLNTMVTLGMSLNSYGMMSLSLYELLQAVGPNRSELYISQIRDLLRMILKEHNQQAFMVNVNYGKSALAIARNDKLRVQRFLGGLLRRKELDLHRLNQITELMLKVIDRQLEHGDHLIVLSTLARPMSVDPLHFGDNSVDNMKSLVNARINYGGKGMGLGHLARIGLPVPAGFTIPVAVWKIHRAQSDFQLWLESYVRQNVSRLEEVVEKLENKPLRFGDPYQPLIVAVRSGSAISLPGMLTTISNVGFNDLIAQNLAIQTDNSWFVYDSYRRFLRDYATSILGMSLSVFHDIIERAKSSARVEFKEELTGDQMREIVSEIKNSIVDAGFGAELSEILSNPWVALMQAIKRVEEGWNDEAIHRYREDHEISHHWATAVSIQRMKFGNFINKSQNLDKDSLTGVAYTRDLQSNALRVSGEYKTNAQGDDLVAIAVRRESIQSITDDMPQAYPKFFTYLQTIGRVVDRYFKGPQDIEFTVERGEWNFLQSRNAELETKHYPYISAEVSPIARGVGASGGAFRGVVGFLNSDFNHLFAKVVSANENAGSKVVDGILILANSAGQSDLPKMLREDVGWVLQRGGYMSHAALNARGEGIPAIVGLSELEVNEARHQAMIISGHRPLIINEGDIFTIDGHTDSGKLYENSQPLVDDTNHEITVISSAQSWSHIVAAVLLIGFMSAYPKWFGLQFNPDLHRTALFAFVSILVSLLLLILHELAHWSEMRFAWTSRPQILKSGFFRGGIGVPKSSGWPGIVASMLLAVIIGFVLIPLFPKIDILKLMLWVNTIFALSTNDLLNSYQQWKTIRQDA